MTADTLPRWDVSSVFPSLESKEFASAHESLGAEIDRLVALYDRHDVRGGDHHLDHEQVAAFEEVVEATNRVLDELRTVQAYVSAFVTTDAGNETAQRRLSDTQRLSSTVGVLQTRLGEWVASLGAEALVQASAVAADHAWPVMRAAQRAEHQMTEAEESLAADLALTGSVAWSRLYRDVTAGITGVVELPSGAEEMPIFAIRGLATHADPAVRRSGFEAELVAWRRHEVPIAAAMNAIKGEQGLLNRRRGWPSDLEAQLFGQSVGRDTFDAMQEAVVDALPHFRRYLRAKARVLGGNGGLAFWDLFAPADGSRTRTWEEAVGVTESVFDGYTPELGDLARRAVDERWIDAGPRKGKSGGAFCMGVRQDESRILMNFDGSFDAFRTLAHELGHAYHNTNLAHRTPLQRATPSSLAETASIFCETIMFHQGLEAAGSDEERLEILEVDLQGSTQVVVDIHSRFLFESEVLDRRARTTLSPSELCELMADAQRAAYGDGLDPDSLHPYMWAAKPHYYGPLFYNWPYTFGLLFGTGLYARYEADPDSFRDGYDDLLSATGLGSAADLAARFDIDVRGREFWDTALAEHVARVDRFCDLVA